MGTNVLKKIIEDNMSIVSKRRYDILYDLEVNYSQCFQLKQRVNALNRVYNDFDRLQYTIKYQDTLKIANYCMSVISKYKDYDENSYLYEYNDEIIICYSRLLRSLK